MFLKFIFGRLCSLQLEVNCVIQMTSKMIFWSSNPISLSKWLSSMGIFSTAIQTEVNLLQKIRVKKKKEKNSSPAGPSALSLCQWLHAACYLLISARTGLRGSPTTDQIYTCKGEATAAPHFLDNWASRAPTGSLILGRRGGANRPLMQATPPSGQQFTIMQAAKDVTHAVCFTQSWICQIHTLGTSSWVYKAHSNPCTIKGSYFIGRIYVYWATN